MSSAQSSSSDRPPESFAVVTPADFAGHKSTIAFSLGELTTEIKHLSKDIKKQSHRLDKLADSTEASLKEQSGALKVIADKILVAEAQVASAFYTSKWFVGVICGLGGVVIGNLKWFLSLLHFGK